MHHVALHALGHASLKMRLSSTRVGEDGSYGTRQETEYQIRAEAGTRVAVFIMVGVDSCQFSRLVTDAKDES